MVSSYGLTGRRLLALLRSLQRESRGRRRHISLLVLGRLRLPLRLWITPLKLRRGVRWVGEAPRSIRLRILVSARALVASSGTGRAWFQIGEALSSGVPVVVPREPSLVELLGDSALYYPADGACQIAGGVWRALDCEVTARLLSRRALDRARLLSWEAFTTRLLDLFPEVAAGAQPGSRSAFCGVVA